MIRASIRCKDCQQQKTVDRAIAIILRLKTSTGFEILAKTQIIVVKMLRTVI